MYRLKNDRGIILNRHSLTALFFISLFLAPQSVLAVGGYSQIIILNNSSDSDLSLDCKGGSRVIREKSLHLAPRRSSIFISDTLVDEFHDLLGGSYNCRVSLGKIRNHKFKVVLENAQEIAVWTVGSSFEQSRKVECEQEYMGNFNRPSQILEDLNSGRSYTGTRCKSIELDS